MKLRCLLLLVAAMSISATALAAKPMLVIHGGAGVIKRDMNPDKEKAIRAKLREALEHGYAQLTAGHPALDAVTAAITVLEDSPYFNAGKGAVFTHDGRNAMDSAIMDGSTLRAGAVAGVHRVKNPILLARAVMEHSKHVMLSGDGAEAFARTRGITLVDPSYFRTDARFRQLQRALKQDQAAPAQRADDEDEAPATSGSSEDEASKHFGTVGAVALDKRGHLAAGTSTGGLTDKRWDRIGDSPIIGAGTYANDQCAVSGTGWGEYYIRTVAAHDICARVKYRDESINDAAEEVINQVIPKLGGDGGAIVLGADGSYATPFNTDGMFRGWIGSDGKPHVAIYKSRDRGPGTGDPQER